MSHLLRLGLSCLRQSGVRVTLARAAQLITKSRRNNYNRWIRRFDTLSERDRELIRRQVAILERQPLISVLMPVYNTPERWLVHAIESVRAQLYEHWELCIADDASTEEHVRRVLESYVARDPRIKTVFRARNGHISAATNSALEVAGGEFVALLDHDDELAEYALALVAMAINQHPQLDLMYSDEDKIDEGGRRFDPYFKPDWNPDLFLSQNVVSHLGVYRSDPVRSLGGLREGFEGSQDYDLALRVIERIPAEHIHHIPHVLYHWRAIEGSTALATQEKSYAGDAARRALESHLQRMNCKAKVVPQGGSLHRIKYPRPAVVPEVSIVLRVDKGVQDVRRQLEQLCGNTGYSSYEMKLVVPSGQHRKLRDNISGLSCPADIEVLEHPPAHGMAAVLNQAATRCHGDFLLFLGDIMEPLSKDWLHELVSHAARPEVGAIGAKLLYANNTIMHGGFLLGIGKTHEPRIAGGVSHQLPRDHPGYFGRARLQQNFCAVSAAAMMLRRELFVTLGAFDAQNLPHAFYDVDFCLRLRAAGYRIVWTPYAELRRDKTAKRGQASPVQYEAVSEEEVQVMRRRWGPLLDRDPFYNPNLDRLHSDFGLGRGLPIVCGQAQGPASAKVGSTV